MSSPSQSSLPIIAAKEELDRIDKILSEPVLLIGGLAVQQYVPARTTRDIDLVCDYDLARSIVDKLYSHSDWETVDVNQDEERPSFVIRHKVATDKPAIYFGPKILERPAYPYLPWSILREGARPFSWKNRPLSHILVPAVEPLCLSKFISLVSRRRSDSDKIRQDASDAAALSNNRDFRSSYFYNSIRRVGAEQYLRNQMGSGRNLDELRSSYLYRLARLFNTGSPDDSVPFPPHVVPVAVSDLTRPLSARNQQVHFDTYERNAKEIRTFALNTIPGLLQTLDYATYIIALYGGAEPRAGAHARLLRQSWVNERGSLLRSILHESVWTRSLPPIRAVDDDGDLIDPDRALYENLDALVRSLSTGNGLGEVGVLTSAASHVPLHGDYSIYDDSMVLIEDLTLSFGVGEEDHVRRYEEHFNALWSHAAKGHEALQMLENIRDGLRAK